MKFSSLMQVPSSKGGILLKMLAKSEPRIAKASGYQVKLVEQSGKSLSNYFSKNLSKSKCHKICCSVCSNSRKKGSNMCGLKSVVYVGVCEICDAKHKKDPSSKHRGIYVGQTYRTLAERAREHRNKLKDFSTGSFMLKHWAIEHQELLEAPAFQFSVVQHHKDPLSRMIHEAVLIGDKASLNSKSEWRGYKVARLTVEKAVWEQRKDIEDEDKVDSDLKSEMLLVRDRAIAHRANVSNVSNDPNSLFVSRKRSLGEMASSSSQKFTGITSRDGVVWNPKNSRYGKRARLSAVISLESPPKASETPEAASTPERSDLEQFSPSDSPVDLECFNTDESDIIALNEAADILSDSSVIAETQSGNEDSSQESEQNVAIDVGNSENENAYEDPSQEGASANALVDRDVSSQENPFKDESTGDSVNLLLLDAIESTSDVCNKFWWSKLAIPAQLRDSVLGKGMKRKCLFCPPLKTKRARFMLDRPEPVFVSVAADDASDVLSEITQNLRGLSICSCDQVSCEFCAINGLCLMVDSISMAPAENSRSNLTKECSPAADNPDLSTQDPHTSGCLNLRDGSQYKVGGTWSIGRFQIKSWVMVSLIGDENSVSIPQQASDEISSETPTGNSIFSKFKTKSFKASPFPPKKKPAVLKNSRRLPKQRSSDKNPPQSRASAKQLGIRAFLTSLDGPMRGDGALDPTL